MKNKSNPWGKVKKASPWDSLPKDTRDLLEGLRLEVQPYPIQNYPQVLEPELEQRLLEREMIQKGLL